MKIIVYTHKDCKKNGQLKIKNNSKEMTKEEFKQYVKDHNLTLSTGYIDLIGSLSNEEAFKCYHNDMVVGVSGIIKEIEKINWICNNCKHEWLDNQMSVNKLTKCPKCDSEDCKEDGIRGTI